MKAGGERDGRRGLLAVQRSLCDVDVLELYRKRRVSSLLGKKAETGHQRFKFKRRRSSNTARHSRKVASEARLWPVGRLIWGLQADVPVLGPKCRRSSSQPQGMGRQVSLQACGSKHLSVCLT